MIGRSRAPFRAPRAPGGFTLVEVLLVIALLVLLAAVLMPTLGNIRGDTYQRGAADIVRSELAAARGRAMEEGVPYRLAVNKDGTRMRRAPDGPEFGTVAAASEPSGAAKAVDFAFERVTVARTGEAGTDFEADGDWVTFAIVMPDGTCREDAVLLAVKEEGRGSMYVRVRGVTGSSKVLPPGSVPNGGNR
jgi:prepilin-type N-terminal cleavage/methylation domain-containing protein